MHGSNTTIATGSVHVLAPAPGTDPGTDPGRVAGPSRPDHHNHVAPRLTMQQAKAMAIRAALAQGCYDIASRIDQAIDRLAVDL